MLLNFGDEAGADIYFGPCVFAPLGCKRCITAGAPDFLGLPFRCSAFLMGRFGVMAVFLLVPILGEVPELALQAREPLHLGEEAVPLCLKLVDLDGRC